MKNAPLPLAVCITLWVAGCSDDPSKQPTCDGKFFGLPSESTGLDADICAPECRCGDVSFVATIHLEEEINRLAATTLMHRRARRQYASRIPPRDRTRGYSR